MSQKVVQILVQPFSHGKTQVVDCFASDKLDSLFQKISDLRGVEVESLKLVYAGREYRHNADDTRNKTLADLGMKDRSMVQLVTRQPGGYAFAGFKQ